VIFNYQLKTNIIDENENGFKYNLKSIKANQGLTKKLYHINTLQEENT
jgi:hypothetical protein